MITGWIWADMPVSMLYTPIPLAGVLVFRWILFCICLNPLLGAIWENGEIYLYLIDYTSCALITSKFNLVYGFKSLLWDTLRDIYDSKPLLD